MIKLVSPKYYQNKIFKILSVLSVISFSFVFCFTISINAYADKKADDSDFPTLKQFEKAIKKDKFYLKNNRDELFKDTSENVVSAIEDFVDKKPLEGIWKLVKIPLPYTKEVAKNILEKAYKTNTKMLLYKTRKLYNKIVSLQENYKGTDGKKHIVRNKFLDELKVCCARLTKGLVYTKYEEEKGIQYGIANLNSEKVKMLEQNIECLNEKSSTYREAKKYIIELSKLAENENKNENGNKNLSVSDRKNNVEFISQLASKKSFKKNMLDLGRSGGGAFVSGVIKGTGGIVGSAVGGVVGGAVGSVVAPGVGTVIGGIVGGMAGAVTGYGISTTCNVLSYPLTSPSFQNNIKNILNVADNLKKGVENSVLDLLTWSTTRKDISKENIKIAFNKGIYGLTGTSGTITLNFPNEDQSMQYKFDNSNKKSKQEHMKEQRDLAIQFISEVEISVITYENDRQKLNQHYKIYRQIIKALRKSATAYNGNKFLFNQKMLDQMEGSLNDLYSHLL
ncbi:MAG: hypothetical protein HQK49_12105 [Oligoflexia bacterium]|nr:hypothetical protein [Oligoflexia bacterium]